MNMEEFYSTQVRDEAVMKVKADPGKIAVDIGAGEGFITEGLLNAGCSVVAVDSSPEMIVLLKQRFGHLKEVRILQSADSDIKLEDDTADYVFAHMRLSAAADPAALAREAKRIAKPGGKIAVTDLLFHKHADFTAKYSFLHSGFTLPDLYEWFVQAGIKSISIEPAGSIKLEDGTKLDFFLAYGEK